MVKFICINYKILNCKAPINKSCWINALGEQAVVFIDPLQWLPFTKSNNQYKGTFSGKKWLISLDLSGINQGEPC